MGSNTSLSQLLTAARLMAEGIKKRMDTVAKVGIDEARVSDIEALTKSVAALDTEQEELKSLLKTKTAALEAEQKKLRAALSEAKKLVKISVEQSDWLTFGINDKR